MYGGHTAVQVKRFPAEDRGKGLFNDRPPYRREKHLPLLRLRGGFRIKADPIHQIIG